MEFFSATRQVQNQASCCFPVRTHTFAIRAPSFSFIITNSIQISFSSSSRFKDNKLYLGTFQFKLNYLVVNLVRRSHWLGGIMNSPWPPLLSLVGKLKRLIAVLQRGRGRRPFFFFNYLQTSLTLTTLWCQFLSFSKKSLFHGICQWDSDLAYLENLDPFILILNS